MSEALAGGDLNLVVREGATVRRPTGPWTPAVHALLRHFEAVGFDGAPRALGIDDEGREILSFVAGDAALAPVPATDGAVAGIGRLLRRMHDAQAGFAAPEDAAWQRAPGAPLEGDVICHGDLFWPNVIFRAGEPCALIDWDLAAPGSRLDDLASAANFWVPLRDDRTAAAWGLPLERRSQRLRALCDGYALDERAGLLAAVQAANERGFALYHQWGRDERRPGWAELWDRDGDRYLVAKQRWLDEHRKDVEAWLS
ncbi:MAG: hypothetical protein QOH73_1816 [Gaiellaceae bacterium]|nr:hypothetical protein [Gaiellaceae bacterium]